MDQVRREEGFAALIKKALCYPFTVWFALSHISALQSRAWKSPEELIDFIFDRYRGIIRPFQDRSELTELIRTVSSLKPKTVLEIGTATGGTLYLFACSASPDASIISVDLPCGRFGGGYAFWRMSLYKSFARPGQKIHLIRGDSHSVDIYAKVKAILGREKLDLLFIDGDHTYEGVKKDFDAYSTLVRKGGYIVMHDIAARFSTEGIEVRRFWEEIKPGFRHKEIMSEKNAKAGVFGIGIIEAGGDEA
jgi:predicted O-methyltransferase YrrM